MGSKLLKKLKLNITIANEKMAIQVKINSNFTFF